MTSKKKLDIQRKSRAKARRSGLCTSCYRVNDRYNRILCSLCQEKKRIYSKTYLRRVKRKTLDAYGGMCACCGETELLFLAIDHIENDGHKEKKSGHWFYAELKKLGFPKGFRVLCHNCNLGRHLNGGTCPHGNGV